MGFIDSLKNIYFKLEDKYYDFLDWVEGKGIPVYKAVDAIESNNVPSFPVAIIAFVLVAAIVYFAVAGFFPANANVAMQVFGEDDSAISGAIVTVNFSDKSLSQATNAEGKASFSIPLGAKVTGSVKKTGYKEEPLDFVVEKADFSKSVSMLLEINTISKTIQLMDKASGALLKKEVSLLFACSANSSYSREKTTNTGTVLLDDIPKDCGTLIATPTSAYTIEQGNIDLSQGAPQLRLSETVVEKGNVKVFLKDRQGNPVAGVTVKLMRSDGVQQVSKASSTAGSAQFDSVPVGNYYIRTYDGYNAKFADFDSSIDQGGIMQLEKDGTIEFNISLVEKVVGKIKVFAKDRATGSAIANAAVSLIRDNSILSTQSTGSDGKIEFAASETSGYSIKVDHQSYLVEIKSGLSPGDSFVEVLLTLANSSNTLSLAVSVADQRGDAVENARLTLKKLDGSVVSDTVATGTDGNVSFERIPAGTYYVYAVKDGFEGVNSSPITIEERQLNNLRITMNIGSGTIEATVLDEELKPIQGAIVKLVNSFNMREIESGNTNSEGKKTFSVRSDKRVFFVASAEDYLDYTTISMFPETGNTKAIEIKMLKDAPKLQVELLGLFVGDDSASDSLAAGQKYVAKMQLRVPASSTFNEAGVHLRTGKSTEGKTNAMEADSLYISKINAATNTIIKSASYTPPSDYATDSKSLTSGNAKWANIIFNKPNPGVYDIEAEITVKENAQLGTILEINYRGWGKLTTYLRDPKDNELGESETSGKKQALYANSYKQLYTVGPSSLCDESFCYFFTIEDLDQDLLTSVIDNYEAKMSGNYKLLFTIVNKESTEFPAGELEIANDSGGLRFSDYVITGADGKKLSGTAEGNPSFSVGDIRKDSPIQGEIIFKTMKEGLSKLKISLKSQKENVFTKAIDVSVSAANEMKLEMLPKIIVPFIDNDIILHVTDYNSETAVSKAAINVFLDNNPVFSGETDSAGNSHFTLQSPNANELLRIEVTKNGYKQLIKEVRVTENILTVTPDELSELLTTTGIFSIERDMLLRNETTMSLQIDDFQISDDFSDLVKFSLKEDYTGTSLQKDVDKNIFLKIELTEEGKRVEEITTLDGVFTIFVSSSDIGKSWAVNIPVRVRIGFGSEVNDPGCLLIEPVTWNAYTGRSQVQQKFALKNNCKVDRTAIALRNVQIKVDYGTAPELGEFTATSSLPESETAKLSNTFENLAPMIGAGEEAGLTITFNPFSDIVGGESTPRVIVRAINQASSGPEEIITIINVNLKINDLAQCVEIKGNKNLRINNCPYGTGYGQYNSYGYGGYGYLGAQQPNYRFASPFQFGDTAFAGYPEQLYSTHYPYSGFSDPFYASQYYGGQGYGGGFGAGAGYNMNWQCGSAKFAIANNCASSVQIDLETSPEIGVGQQTFSLSPGEQKQVDVQASYFIGTYPIEVKAKIKESKEKSYGIATLYANIEIIDDPSQFRDCIKLNSTKFKFNDFVQKPVTGKVFNTCFAQGVRLDYDSVRFSQSAYGEKIASGTGGAAAGQGLIENVEVIDLTTKSQGNNKVTQILEFEIYKNINYRRQEGFPRSGTPFSQIGDLRVFATGSYFRVEAPAIIIVNYSSSIGGAQSRRFSVTVEDMWNVLGTLEGLNVYGCSNIPAQKCIMETALDFGDLCATDKFGNNMVYQETRDIMRVGECSPEAATNQNINSKITEIMQQNPSMTYQQAYEIAKGTAGTNAGVGNVCGTADKIYIDEGFTTIVQDGVVVTFELAPSTQMSFLGQLGGKHSLRVTIDKSGATRAGCFDITKTLSATVLRQTPLGSQKVVIPFHVRINSTQGQLVSEDGLKCANGIKTQVTDFTNVTQAQLEAMMAKFAAECGNLGTDDKKQVYDYLKQVTKPTVLVCENGMSSGSGALDAIQFSRLPFSWQFENINKDTCDKGTGNKYCDSVQNLIAITKKTKEIKEKLDAWKGTMEGTNAENAKAALGKTSLENSDYTAKNLFRWALKQVKINNGTNNEKRVYFISAADQRILNSPIKASSSMQSSVDAAKTALSSENLDQMDPLLTAIAGDSKLSKDIVVEIKIGSENGITKDSALADKTKDTDYLKNNLKADSIEGDILALTFEEFKEFYSAAKNACVTWSDCKTSTATVEVKGKKLDKAFFNRLLNSVSFKRGIRNTADLKKYAADETKDNSTKTALKEDLDFVLGNAATISGISKAEFDDVWKALDSTILLAKDGYNANLQKDFREYYTEQKTGSEFSATAGFIGDITKTIFSFGAVPQTTAEAGIYELFLNYNFSGQSMAIELKKAGEPEEKIKDNWFLYNPIDGQVGAINGRTGYGTTFGAGNDNIAFLKEGGEGKENEVIAAKGTGISGSVYSSAKIDSSLEAVEKGTILSAGQPKFNYSPSTAFKLEMKLKGLGNKAALYSITQGGMQLSRNPLISWDVAAEQYGLTPAANCGTGGYNEYYGFETSAGSEEPIRAPFFVPASTQYALNLWCAKDEAELTATEIDIKQQASPEQKINATTSTINQAVSLPSGRTDTRYYLKQYLDAVAEGTVCMSSTATSLKLAWNPETITK